MSVSYKPITADVVEATRCACHGNVMEAIVQGVPEGSDFLDLIGTCYAKFDFMHALWDFRNSSVSGLGFDDFKKVAEATALFEEKRGVNAKTAILVSAESDILLFRAFSDNVKGVLACEMRAFRDEEDARAWLNN